MAILLWLPAQGEDDKDFAYYNQLTYNQYMAGNWKDLVQTGKEAIEAGHDSYYMRMRLGIALYSLENYRQAIGQFKVAIRFDPGSVSAKEYLYYSNIFTGNEQEAQSYYDMREKSLDKFFYSLYIEGGYKYNSSDETYTGNLAYGLIGLKHQFSPRVNYFQTYQYLRRGVYTDGRGNGNQSSQQDHILQNEYYGKLDILAAHGFWVIPAFHYQNWTFNSYGDKNWLISLGFVKDLGLTRLYADVNRSNVNSLDQWQVNGGIALYPLGNLNFYIDGRFIYFNESSDSNLGGRYMLGGRISKTTWLDGWYAHGSMRHFSENNGAILFNSPNTINSRMGITLAQSLGRHMLYLNFIREEKTEIDTEIDFLHYDIILGLNIKF